MKRMVEENKIGDWMWTELEVKQKMTSVHEYGIDYKRARGRTRKREGVRGCTRKREGIKSNDWIESDGKGR